MDFKQLFKDKTGIDLEKELGSSNKIEPFRLRITNIILEYIKEQCPTYDEEDLTDYQKQVIDEAIIEQGYYIISTGVDLTTYLGIDNVTGQTTPIADIRKRIIAPLARQKLKNAGLLFKGFGSGTKGSYYSSDDFYKRFVK